MGFLSYCYVTMWTLIFTYMCVFNTVSEQTDVDDFTYVLRTRIGHEWILSPVPDTPNVVDEWPDGSYTVFMSKYGCPRGIWSRGYISFTWRTPHVMLSHTHVHHCNSNTIATHEHETQCYPLLSEQTWPITHTFLFGPFSQYKMTLNFCVKTNTTTTRRRVTNITWPGVNFRLFGANDGCPTGFINANHTLVLPPVKNWTENGALPYFSVNTDESEMTLFTLRECVREEPIKTNYTPYLNTSGSTFILLKHGDHQCPAIESYDVWSEIISLVALQSTIANVSRLFDICYYQPKSWNVASVNTDELKGFELRRFKVLNGGTLTAQDISGQENYDVTHTMFCSELTCRVLFDLGRGFHIKAVILATVTPPFAVFNYTVQAGNDKWSLLRYGGVDISRDTMQCVGRYIVFAVTSLSVVLQHFDIRVFVELDSSSDYNGNLNTGGGVKKKQASNRVCMVDFGMTDARKTLDQISYSSKTSEQPDSVGPYDSGWCANSEDRSPYIQVDLLEELSLNGITIYNWYQTEVNIIDGVYRRMSVPMGTRSFTLLFSQDGNNSYTANNINMSFEMDLYRPLDEPQTFIFYKEIIAQHVRIQILEAIPQGRLCLRFEIHGCPANDIIHRPSLIFHDIKNTLAGAVQTLTSPSYFTSFGYPMSYQDGTSYTWIVDFRTVGYISIVFKEIVLQNVEDRSLSGYRYHCNDTFDISSPEYDYVLSVPMSQRHKTVIFGTEVNYLLLEFMSCRPYTTRQTTGTYFNAFVEKADLPTCVQKDFDIYTQCDYNQMVLTPLSLTNADLSAEYVIRWILTSPMHSIRLTITHFHIMCDPDDAAAHLHIEDGWTNYFSNCMHPGSTFFAESEIIYVVYKYKHVNRLSLMKEGFQAIFGSEEIIYPPYLDTSGHDFPGLAKIIKWEYTDEGTAVLAYKACSSTFMKCFTIYGGGKTQWQVASDECLARNKQLVSIRSKEELAAVKYILRTFRKVKHEDGSLYYLHDSTRSYCHIGISRKSQVDGTWYFVWHDGSPVVFTAWQTGQPTLDGNCVRMGFHQAYQNNTWEVEDCLLAAFFMCEETVDSLPLPDITTTINPKTYNGSLNVTRSGRVCERWDVKAANDPDDWTVASMSSEENYCRDPNMHGYLWCYTVDRNIDWEKCSIKSSLEDSWSSSKYTGRLSVTKHGHTCQRWDTQDPHIHNRNHDEYFPDTTVSDAANYCRDPEEEKGALWCYTTNVDIRWDWCQMKDTLRVADRCYEAYYPYNGTLNVTHSGLACQRWDSSYPHISAPYADTDFPERNKSKAENYCRDPSNEGYIWCYTTNPDVERQVCFVQVDHPSSTGVSHMGLYTCNDGNQISMDNLCNGIVDCVDAVDELNCHNQIQKLVSRQTIVDDRRPRKHTQFLCGSNETIIMLAQCDGIVDCIDGTDEEHCSRNMAECSRDEFQCGNGQCIDSSLVCDFIHQCTDMSDENCVHPSCKDGDFRCKNGECISAQYRCNAYRDCIDGSDEDGCVSCSDDAFECDTTKCIPPRLVCDGVLDCRDSNDEKACSFKQYLSCEERWLKGLYRNGIYSLNPMNEVVECNFDDVLERGSLSTIFHVDERKYRDEGYVTYLRNTSGFMLFSYFMNEDYHCLQTFTQTCDFPTQYVAKKEQFQNGYQHCACVAMTVQPSKPETAFVHACNNMSHVLDNTRMYVKYEFLILKKKTQFRDDIDVQVGPIVCKNDAFLKPMWARYDGKRNITINGITCQRWDQQSPHVHTYSDAQWFPDDDVVNAENFCRDPSNSGYIWCYTIDPSIKWQNCTSEGHSVVKATHHLCDEHDLIYPADLRCVYKVDTLGYILGCRSGSHLSECSDFICPEGTAKCPASYCVPLHYICDGINQCPGSEDEHGCGCNNNDLEVIFLIAANEFLTSDMRLRQIAAQFNNLGSIVRIVSYSVRTNMNMLPFDHKVLEITDVDVNMKNAMNIEHNCTYRIQASDYIERVRFTNVSTRAIIFVQNGTESRSVAQHLFQNTIKPDFDIYRIVIGTDHKSSNDQEYAYVTDIRVNTLETATSMGSKLFPALCKDSSTNLCQGNYKCSSSKLCITLDQVCDGFVHCPFSDDEMFCDNFVRPPTCSCTGYNLHCSSVDARNYSQLFESIGKTLRILDLNGDVEIGKIGQENLRLNFPYMIKLNMSNCSITQLSANQFEGLPNLRSLDLSFNKIQRIPRLTFYGLAKLVKLNLYGNEVFTSYDKFAFSGLISLRQLDIVDSKIDTISSHTFSGLKLDSLQVSRNTILEFSDDAFMGLAVRKIVFESNVITTFKGGLFNGISDLESLRTSAYQYCCIRPDYLPESECFPERDEFSSCEDLMRNSVLQTLIWLMGFGALLGNIMAILYRMLYDRKRLKLGYGIFVTNLAVADLLMGVYLLIIAAADASFRKRYIFMDEYWRTSVWCTLAGTLSTVSSEASVFFLCLITLDRVIVIKYPFSQLRFTTRSAVIAASLAWIMSISISVTPLIAEPYFRDMFYSKSGVCVALPLTRDRPPGWLYSIIIFISVNFVTFVGIALGQLSIYLEINKTSSKIKHRRGGNAKANRRKELTIARNLFLVVTTDFLCWFPICCMGMMAMSGHVIPGEIYAWVVVMVLPVNSALNPALYTLTAIRGRRTQQGTYDSSSVSRHGTSSAMRSKLGHGNILPYYIHKEKMISVEHIIQHNTEMTPYAVLKFTKQLTDCLHTLHENSMILEDLDASCVCVRLVKGKVTGDIQIRKLPKHGAPLEEKKDNIYQLGVIVRRLMNCNPDMI